MVMSKLAQQIFASTDENGTARSISEHDAAVWGTEVERILSALGAGQIDPDELPVSWGIATDSGTGSPNAIQAMSASRVTEAVLVVMNIVKTNGHGPTTVRFNGSGPNYTIKTNTGNDPAPEGLIGGMYVLGRIIGSEFRLITDQVSSALIAQAESLVERVEDVVGDLSGYDSAGFISSRVFSEDNGDVAIPSAIASAAGGYKTVDLGGKTWEMSGVPVNEYGVRLDRGKVLVPSKIAGQKTQYNSYAPDACGLVVGRENLALFMLFATQPASSGVACNVHMYGDSTVELNDAYAPGADGMVKMALRDAGCEVTEVYNHGVSGTSWSDIDALPHLGPTTNLLIIKTGINDGSKSNPLATLVQDARGKLAEIRAAPYGGVTACSILLMGPSSTYAPTTNQDAKWYEDLRNVYVQLCKDFDCCFVDTYAYMQDTKHAPGFWMDDFGVWDQPFTRPGEGLHFNPLAAHWFYRGMLGDLVFGGGGWNSAKTNTNWNILKNAEAVDGPAKYQIGVTRQGAFVEQGFPSSGNLVTERFATGQVNQVIRTADVVPQTFRRTGFVSNGIWTQWTGSSGLIPLINGWSNQDINHQPLGYQVGDDGFVDIFGVIKGGGTGVFCFEVPSPVRPALNQVFYNGPYKFTAFASGPVNIAFTAPATNDMVPVNLRYKALSP